MKVLWTVNLIPAELAKKLEIPTEVLGGWVESMAKQIRKRGNIELAIACKANMEQQFMLEIQGIKYYSLSYASKKDSDSLIKQCENILDNFKPDLVQIEGTEFIHSNTMLYAAKRRNVPTVVSMQGILNGYYNYQCGLLQMDDMMFSKSLSNMFASWILHFRKVFWFKPRMKPEQEIIKQADYILGRTSWDRAHSYAINPEAEYFVCNRVLRAPFYDVDWNIDSMERHSIYVGNGYSALKGVHFVIQALPQLIREYPDIKVYVAGYKPYENNDKRSILKQGYAMYLKKLIQELNVEKYVVLTGPLKADEVADRLSKVNAYVLCSTIENSPNTLGEAMMVGTPCVAAYVGGVSDMAIDGKEALHYRCDDPKMLAWNIKKIFDSDELALNLSKQGRDKALKTHDAASNAEQLLRVYQEILNIES